MRHRRLVVDNYAHAGVRTEVVDVPFGVVGVRIVALLGEEEDGVVVVGAEGGVVHCPEEVARGVYFEADADCDCGCWVGCGAYEVIWDGGSECVVGAGGGGVGPGCGVGFGFRIGIGVVDHGEAVGLAAVGACADG